MLRTIVAIVAGLLVAFLIVFVSDALFHAAVPGANAMPADTNDRAAMADYVAGQPSGVLFGLVLGWALAALVGSGIAARGGRRGEWPGWVVGGLFLLATASNFLLVPHPAWMVGLAVVAIVAAAWLGARWGAAGSPMPRA